MTMEDIASQEIEPTIEVDFSRLVEDEINRVKYSYSKYDWYKKNKYKIIYPKSIQEKLDQGVDVTEEDIVKAVEEEFESFSKEQQISELKEAWSEISGGFFDNLKTLGLPLQEKYIVSVTQYGTGGSYEIPNRIILNIGQIDKPALTIAHETVHLTIEHLIKKFDIEHWTKERIVDLIMNKFFPHQQRLQRNPDNSEKIDEIFEKEFPNIENVLVRISEMNDLEKLSENK